MFNVFKLFMKPDLSDLRTRMIDNHEKYKNEMQKYRLTHSRIARMRAEAYLDLAEKYATELMHKSIEWRE